MIALTIFPILFFHQCELELATSNREIPITLTDRIDSSEQNHLFLQAEQLICQQEYRKAEKGYQQLLASNQLSKQEVYYAQLQLLRCQLRNGKISDESLIDSIEIAFQDELLSKENLLLYNLVKARLKIKFRKGVEAIQLLTNARKIADELFESDRLVQLEILTLLGKSTYLYAKRPNIIQIVLHYLDEADKLLLENKDWSPYAQDHYLWKANLSFVSRDVDFSSLSLAINTMKQQPDGIDYGFLARCYSVKGRLFKHEAHFNMDSIGHYATKALELVRTHAVDEETTQTVYRDYLTYSARLEGAKLFLNTLQELELHLHNTVNYVSLTRLKGFLYNKIGDTDKAIKAYLQLLKELEEGKHFYNLSKLYDEANYALGGIYRKLGDFDSSNKHYLNVLLIGTEKYGNANWSFEEMLNSKMQQDNIYSFFPYANLAENQFRLYEQEGEKIYLERAIRLYHLTDEQCFEYLFHASNNASLNLIGELPRQYYSNAIQAHLYLYEITQNSKYLRDANYFMERMKSFLLQRELFVIDYEKEIGDLEIIQEQREIRKKIQALTWKKIYEQEDVDQKIQQLRAQYNANREEIVINYPDYNLTQNQYNQQIFNRLDTWIKSDSFNTVIQYAIGKESIHILLNRMDTTVLKRVELSSDSLDRLVGEYLHVLINAKPTGDDPLEQKHPTLSYQLFQILVEPVHNLVPRNSRVLIVQDTKTSNLPFKALLTQKLRKIDDYTKAPYLINDWMIHAAPSLKTFLSEKENTMVANPKILAFSITDKDYKTRKFSLFQRQSSRIELLSGVKELETLEKLYGKTGNTFSYGAAMNNENINLHIKKDYDIIHFSAHANADSVHYSNNRISLYGEGEFLYGFQISALALRNRPLVVLSACETAVGVQKATGAFSFSRSFLEAGADKVIATLWKVSERTSSEIIQDFYHYLSKDGEVVKALWQAQKEYIGKHERVDHHFAHPQYWAGISCWE